MTTYNPLERASIALSQIGLEAAAHGMPQVQHGLDCLSAQLGLRAGDADEQVVDGQPAPQVMAEALSEAVLGAVGLVVEVPRRHVSWTLWALATWGLVDAALRILG